MSDQPRPKQPGWMWSVATISAIFWIAAAGAAIADGVRGFPRSLVLLAAALAATATVVTVLLGLGHAILGRLDGLAGLGAGMDDAFDAGRRYEDAVAPRGPRAVRDR